MQHVVFTGGITVWILHVSMLTHQHVWIHSEVFS